jgi:hypothetical protein
VKDIVIVPTFLRPEYLTLCLEHIKAAKGNRNIEVRVYHDNPRRTLHVDVPASRTVVAEAGLNGYFVMRPPHNAIGNTLNFLEAYGNAFEDRDARYVYLIEDDVFIGEDFFDWHEAVQARADYFCSVGWHCIRNPLAIRDSPDPNAIVESKEDFSSIGVCWKRHNLAAVVRHATPDYYTNPTVYLAREFPDSPIPCNRWVEQAGLIMRLLLERPGKRVVAWAGRPRCAHVGVKGYHRMSGPTFTTKELRNGLASGTLVQEASHSFDDINGLPEFKPWTPEGLYVAQRF